MFEQNAIETLRHFLVEVVSEALRRNSVNCEAGQNKALCNTHTHGGGKTPDSMPEINVRIDRKEAARILGVSTQTISYRIKTGKIAQYVEPGYGAYLLLRDILEIARDERIGGE